MRSDYAEDLETEIDHGPHWSALGNRRHATIRPEQIAPVPPRLPRAKQVSSAPLPSRNIQVAPAGKIASISHAPPRPNPAPPVPAHVLAAAQRAPIAPLGYLAPPSQFDVQTERVAPLPLESLRPGLALWLDTAWQRFAGPICGAIAGLILVVGYLAYSSQPAGKRTAALGTAAVPAPRVVLPAIAMTASQDPELAPAPVAVTAAPIEALVDAPIPAEVSKSLGRPARATAPTVSMVSIVRPSAPPSPVSAKRSRRAPIHLNDSTPLGDLRVRR